MKKTLLLLSIALMSFGYGYSQTDLVNEDFETVVANDPVAITGWNNYIEVGTRNWLGKEFETNKYAQATAYNSGEANTMWLITPEVDLNAYEGDEFSFDVNIGYWTHAALTIWVSTDYDGSNVGAATWTDITGNFTIPTEPTGGYGTFASAGTMDISTYTGNFYVAFKYVGDDNASQTTTIQIDNVLVTGILGINDIQAKRTFSFGPNPATDYITINEGNQYNRVSIANANGQVVYSSDNAAEKIDVSNLAEGVYFISIDDNGTLKSAKFIVR